MAAMQEEGVKTKGTIMFKGIFELFRRKLIVDLPGCAHLCCDLGIEQVDCRDTFLARHIPNLGGWV